MSWLYANIREVQYKYHAIIIQNMTSCLLHVKEAPEMNSEARVASNDRMLGVGR